MIYILTGPVRTGKTSALLEWCKNRTDVDGLLCPDDANRKRYFLNIKSKEKFPLEVEENKNNKDDIISVGPFHFLKKAFNIANEYLINLKDKPYYSYLVIDELGRLELQNKGLYLAAKTLIPYFITNEGMHLILIVRESLKDEVVSRYNITNYSVIKKEDLEILK